MTRGGLLPALASVARPVLVGGDFNMVPWSHTLARFAQATGTERAGSILYTLPLAGGWVALPIDHVLVPRGMGRSGTRRLPLLGSDHHGVLAGFALAE